MNRTEIKRQKIVQLILVLVVIILVCYISSFVFVRFDLTSEKRYTLSSHTKQLLKDLDDEVIIKIYLEGDDLPVVFKRLQGSVKDLIEEFKVYSSNNIRYEFINPTANPDKKIRFGLYNQLRKKGIEFIESQDVGSEGKTSQKLVFPAVSVVYKGNELAVNLLKSDPLIKRQSEENINNSIQSLEYEFTNALRKLSRKSKQQIAFIEGHAELPQIFDAAIQGTLSEYYLVKRGRIGGKPGVLDSFAAVIIAKPVRPFDEKDKFVIDQYIMKGGKVMWFIDGVKASLDSLAYSPSTMALASELNLDDQLFKYGVRINPDLILDLQCSLIGVAQNTSNGQPKINLFPWLYYPVVISQSNHPVNRYLNVLKTEFVSSIDTVNPTGKVKKTILLNSSANSKIEVVPVRISFDNLRSQPNTQQFRGVQRNIAVLLEGKFTSVFKNRTVNKLTNGKFSYSEESKPTKMIVVSDGDIIKNEVSSKGEPYPLGFDKNTQKTFKGNSEFILNAVNYLCDDEGLMSIRMRDLTMRLLDKDRISDERVFWQATNVLVPVIFVIFFGLFRNYLRKRKYAG